MQNAGSFRLSRQVAGAYALGFILLLVGLYSMLALEFYWRVPDLLGFYFWEAMLAMLTPFILYGLADIYVMETYRETGLQIRNQFIVHMIMDDERCEQIRRSARFNPLVLWMLPQPVRRVREQLASISLWYGALTHPEGSPPYRALRDPLLLGLACWLLVVCVPAILLPVLGNGASPPRWMVLLLLGLLGIGSLLAGFVLLRRCAIQMALGDFLDGDTYDTVI